MNKKSIYAIFAKRTVFLLVLFIAATFYLLADTEEIAVQLRFYEGMEENGNNSGIVISSYYQKKSTDDTILPFVEVNAETEKLKEIYNLKDVKPIGNYDVVLRNGRAVRIFTDIVMSGKKLAFRVAPVREKTDRFAIKLFEGSDKNVLLESEIIVPEEKTAVYGFKDSKEKIYFLAFNRKKEIEFADLKKGKTVESPRLVMQIEPEYPRVALKARISGDVLLIGSTDIEGNVINTRIIQGHPLFRQAVINSIRNWKYVPWKVNGVQKRVYFSVIAMFRLSRESITNIKKESQLALKNYKPRVKGLKPENGLPRIMELITVFGDEMKPKSRELPPQSKESTLRDKLRAKDIESPKLVRRIEPIYPEVALKVKIEGNVILRLFTDSDARIIDVKPLSGHPLLAKASINAIMKWKYTPWNIDGVQKPVEANIILIFRLKKIPENQIDSQIKSVIKTHTNLLGKSKPTGEPPRLMEVIIVEGE